MKKGGKNPKPVNWPVVVTVISPFLQQEYEETT